MHNFIAPRCTFMKFCVCFIGSTYKVCAKAQPHRSPSAIVRLTDWRHLYGLFGDAMPYQIASGCFLYILDEYIKSLLYSPTTLILLKTLQDAC
jgi:hypothetical protein